MATMTEALLTFSGPVFEIDGDVKAELARDIVRLEIEENTAGLKSLTARLIAEGQANSSGDQVQLYLDGSIVDFGKKISVVLGASPAAHTVFTGWISAIEASFEEVK